jgi:hypothetical protein
MPILESADEYAGEAIKRPIFQRFFVKAPDRLRRPRVEGVGKEEKLFRTVR